MPPPADGADGACGAGGVVGVELVDSTFVPGFWPVVESMTWSVTSWADPESRRTRTPVTSRPTQTGSVTFFVWGVAPPAFVSFDPGSGPLSNVPLSAAFSHFPSLLRNSNVY